MAQDRVSGGNLEIREFALDQYTVPEKSGYSSVIDQSPPTVEICRL